MYTPDNTCQGQSPIPNRHPDQNSAVVQWIIPVGEERQSVLLYVSHRGSHGYVQQCRRRKL